MRILTHPMAAILAVLLCVPAAAQDNRGFSHYEKSVIQEYFRQKADTLMPGEWEIPGDRTKEEDETDRDRDERGKDDRGRADRDRDDRGKGDRGRADRDDEEREVGRGRGMDPGDDRKMGRGHGQFGKGKSDELPPGLAKREELPPGLARQLRERGTLPPGLAKRDLPEDLDSRLPEPEPDEQRVIVDDDVVLIDKTTQEIIDIIEGVVTGGNAE